MNLFLCSRFCNVGTLIKENLQNKRIAFIPTAAAKEGVSRYVLAGRELLSEMGAIVTEIDISKENRNTIKAAFAQADCIYFSGGNSFFLMDALRKSGTDKLLKKNCSAANLWWASRQGLLFARRRLLILSQWIKTAGVFAARRCRAWAGKILYFAALS